MMEGERGGRRGASRGPGAWLPVRTATFHPSVQEDLPSEFPSPDEATQILFRAAQGEGAAEGELFEIVYQELRRIADRQMRGQGPGHTLQATALVHEAFLRIFGGGELRFESRQHFLATAAVAMRQVLVDHARRRKSVKRGGDRQPVRIDTRCDAPQKSEIDLDVLDLHQALEELNALDERQGRLVELRYFGGLEVEEVARVLDVSKTTVEREWRAARAWLGKRLQQGHGD